MSRRLQVATLPNASPKWVTSALFAMSRDESGLPPTPERLRQRSEPIFRATFRKAMA
jgi:hypothetical protein